ncbi:peptidase A4 family-domain-containing protein [Phanerochaete sordida]|uniref:Peptidase A4 family-domain-containing protein n=1 Tax=Phanerochaete sordida TaxID=48140 RepID=A0A9P3LLZ2_9APHY|nr:peptidase A4 family-domain-containing protein [Phanerochaete sordida]
MLFSSLVVSSLLAASAFALPSSKERHDARVARRAGGLRQSVPRITNSSHVEYSSNWAGAVYNSAKGTYKSVTATFVVPTPKSSGGGGSQAASAWVGIDGDTCGNAILQTGVDFNVDGSSVSYDAWYEWYPDYAYDFSGITFKAGDSVTLTVTASSTTKGTAVITNNSNGKSVSKSISSSSALCEQDAEWIVEDFEEGNSLVPFANFGTVTFTGASAKTASSSVGPSSANIIDIQQNGKTLTSVSTSGSSVTVSYV